MLGWRTRPTEERDDLESWPGGDACFEPRGASPRTLSAIAGSQGEDLRVHGGLGPLKRSHYRIKEGWEAFA